MGAKTRKKESVPDKQGLIVRRTAKDSVFCNLFSDKRYLLQLYQALHPEDTETTEDDLTDITIRNVLTDGIYNDVGFRNKDKVIILTEAQSTWSMNILIRMLLYLAETYHDYFRRTKQNLYGNKKVKMPKPELYVIFTGERKTIPDIISLSKDFFNGAGIAVDAQIKVLYQENEGDIIGQYIIFCKVYQEQRKCYGNTRETVTETIRICKDRNVLKEYLESREKEVVDIMMTLFDEEQIYKAFENDIKQETVKNKAIFMVQKGKIAIDEIAEYFPELSEEDRKEIESQVLQQV